MLSEQLSSSARSTLCSLPLLSSLEGSLEEVWPGHEAAVESTRWKFTQLRGSGITAFSSPSWQAGWWNDKLWFQKITFQSASVGRGQTGIPDRGWNAVGSNYWDVPCAPVELFCSLWIFMCASVLSSQAAGTSSPLGQSWKFSLCCGICLLHGLQTPLGILAQRMGTAFGFRANTQGNPWTLFAARVSHLEGTEACPFIFWWITPTTEGFCANPGHREGREGDLLSLQTECKLKTLYQFVIHDPGQILLVFCAYLNLLAIFNCVQWAGFVTFVEGEESWQNAVKQLACN